MINYKFYLRSSRTNKAGESALYFIVNASSPIWIGTKIFIIPDHWNQTKETLKPSCPDFHILSPKISNLQLKADLYLQQVNLGQLTFSEEGFKEAVITGDLNKLLNPKLIDLIDEYVASRNLSLSRIKQYKVLKNIILDFRPGVRLNQVNYVFALEMKKHLQTNGNIGNTIATRVGQFKAVMHYAMHKGILKEDPLKAFRVPSKFASVRTSLTVEELLTLQLQFDNKKLSAAHHNVLRYFLFACYTGLRYGDIQTLERNHITNDTISIVMHKTQEPVIIPLPDQAKELLDHDGTGRCFRVLTNQKTNKYLKEIGKAAGIKKTLTFHVSRHTFATISLSLEIPIKVISKLLGHTKVSTTEIYTHVMEEMKKEQMKKWNGLRVA